MSGPTLQLGGTIRAGLAGLRAKARTALAVRGASTLTLLAVALSLTSFGLDRTLRLAWETRAVALALAGTGLLLVVYRRLWRPLSAPLSDVELARRVEATHPDLRWRLLSAVQFADPGWSPGPETSRELAACIVRDAEALAREVRFGDAVPGAPTARAGTRGLLVAAAGLALVLGFPQAANTWFLRNVLLSEATHWPRDTRLTLQVSAGGVLLTAEEGRYTVPRGTDLTFHVAAQGVVPARVYLTTQPLADDGEAEDLVLDALEGGRFRTTLGQVASSFEFEVEGGDDAQGPWVVRVLDRPWIERLELEVAPPAYTGLPSRRFPLESSSVSLPRGTRVRAHVLVSKPLRSASLGVLRLGAEDEVAVVHTGAITTSPAGFTAELALERSGVVDVRLVDQDQLEPERPTRFTLVAVPDQSPQVRLRLRGVGLNVTPDARIGYSVQADDDYGLTAGALAHRARLGSDDPVEGATPLGSLAEGGAQGTLELAPLGLKPKMALALWAEATDIDPLGPNVGSSPALQLRIVTPEQLLAELLRRLHEQRLELERLIAQEDQLAQGLSAGDEDSLGRAPVAQQDVGRSVLAAAETVEGVVEEMVSNQILDETTWSRLRKQVADALRALHEGRLLEATELAEAAAGAEGPARALSAGLAGEAAKAVARELRVIVERMGRIEELAELISVLKKIIRDQRELMDETKKRGGD